MSVLITPLTLPRAFLTVMGQVGQFMPGTDKVIVWGAAQIGEAHPARTAHITSVFMRVFLQ
jgi:hypothetical protein